MNKASSLLLLLLIALSPIAQSAISEVNISGASVYEQDPGTEVWGVMVGTHSNDTDSTPYDNCGFSLDDTETTNGTNGEFHGCHPQRVNGNTAVTISFRESDEVTNQDAIVYIEPDNTDTNVDEDDLLGRSSLGSSGSNLTFTVSFTWRELCEKIIINDSGSTASFDPLTQTCSHNGALTLAFGVESSNLTLLNANRLTFYLYSPDDQFGLMNGSSADCEGTFSNDEFGFCSVSIYPGDEGGFIQEDDVEGTVNQSVSDRTSFTAYNTRLGGTTSVPLQITHIRAYMSPIDCTSAQPNVKSTNVVQKERDEFLAGNIITFVDNEFSGLENNTEYFVRAATVDESGTISQLFSDNYCVDPFSFTPSEVAGIIRENECFITTATYGSDQAHQVHLFRKFRKMFLYGNSMGEKIIVLYNTYGPLGAKWIRENPSSKTYMRALLYPFYGFAYLSVHYGLFKSIILFSLLVFLIVHLIRFKKEGEE